MRLLRVLEKLKIWVFFARATTYLLSAFRDCSCAKGSYAFHAKYDFIAGVIRFYSSLHE